MEPARREDLHAEDLKVTNYIDKKRKRSVVEGASKLVDDFLDRKDAIERLQSTLVEIREGLINASEKLREQGLDEGFVADSLRFLGNTDRALDVLYVQKRKALPGDLAEKVRKVLPGYVLDDVAEDKLEVKLTGSLATRAIQELLKGDTSSDEVQVKQELKPVEDIKTKAEYWNDLLDAGQRDALNTVVAHTKPEIQVKPVASTTVHGVKV